MVLFTGVECLHITQVLHKEYFVSSRYEGPLSCAVVEQYP